MSISSVPNIEGFFTVLITPFKNGKIDWEGFEMNIEFQISQGVSGVVPAGTTGESSTLTSLEHKLLISRCAKIVKKKELLFWLVVVLVLPKKPLSMIELLFC